MNGLFVLMGIIALCLLVYVGYDFIKAYFEMGPYEDELEGETNAD